MSAMKQVLKETASSTRVKVLDPPNGNAAHRYLRSQSNIIGTNIGEGLVRDLYALEKVLNFEAACDVAVGSINVLTVNETPAPAPSSSSSSSALAATSIKDWGAFWDPSVVGYHLPVQEREGDELYYGGEDSPVGIAGTGTVVDADVRRSTEVRFSKHAKNVFAKLKEKAGDSGCVRDALTMDTVEGVKRVFDGVGAEKSAQPHDDNDDNPHPPFPIPPALLFFQFPDEIENIRQRLCPLSPSIRVVPYKVVAYKEGDYFLPHVDSMDHNALQFGSLAVQLPIEYPEDETHDTSNRIGAREEPSHISGELVFYLGRELSPEGKQHEPTLPGEHSQFRNKGWTSYGRPTNDEEQLRIRVDLTTHLPSIPVTRGDVSQWMLRKQGLKEPKWATPSGTSGSQFKVQPLKYAAWQGDIPHEVTRVTHGYRAVILYRLVKDFSSTPKVGASSPLTFLTEASRSLLACYSKEPSGIKPFPHYPRSADLNPTSGDANGTVWDQFMSQTKELRNYTDASYRSVIAPSTRHLIHKALARVFHNLRGSRKPVLPPVDPPGCTNGTQMLESVVTYLSKATPEKLPASYEKASDISHIAFVLRHQYPPAVQRILFELQTGAADLSTGERARMIMTLLKGGDAILYALLTEVAEVSIHATHQLKSDYSSTPYRLTSSAGAPWYGRWIQHTYPSHIELASTPLNPDQADAGVKKVETEIDLARESAHEDVGDIYPSIVDCAWVSMGLGKVIGGGQSFGNADCGADWWYRSSVMIVNPSIPSKLFWRRKMLMLVLQKNVPQDTPMPPAHPLITSLRKLAHHPDLFLYICNFM